MYIKLDDEVLIPNEVLNPLRDDLNTPGYIANLHELFSKAINGSEEDKKLFNSACNFIGLLTQSKEEWLKLKKSKLSLSVDEINLKIKERNNARDQKNYELADKIRKELSDNGILIEDKDGKTTWKLK